MELKHGEVIGKTQLYEHTVPALTYAFFAELL